MRKDLSYLGSYGTRGVGYDVAYLVYQIKRELGLHNEWKVVVVGAGNLGNALANYSGFTLRGFPVAGVVDIDASKVGRTIAGVQVRHVDELESIVRSEEVSIGVIATPPHRHTGCGPAREGRRSLDPQLRFGGTHRSRHDLGAQRRSRVELQILGYYEQLSRDTGKDKREAVPACR